MKLISIVKSLQSQGVDIKYRIRKDGGILVTQVSGMRFTAAEGNRFVRNLSGQQLSEAQIKQRQAIKPPKRISPSLRKKPPVPEDIKKTIRKLQSVYRKDKKRGKPTIRNIRYVIENMGEEEARRQLKMSEYYVRGIAYDENIDAIIQRLRQIKVTVSNAQGDSDAIQGLIDETITYKNTYRDKFSFDKVGWLMQIIYDFERDWNAAAQGTDSNDKNSILTGFVANYLITLKS